MKPYQEHLQSVLSFGETVSPTRKPVFRSSAIFPVIHNHIFATRVLFMGYWLRKRNIPEVTILVSLRDEFGKVLIRKTLIIEKVKAYQIPIPDLLSEIQNHADDFIGSIELEVFSTRDMVFPYPAFVVNFFSEYGYTSVHTTGRIYNDVEDMSGNEKYKVPESGFDIYSGEENSPFFCFVNGPFNNSGKSMQFEIIDESQNVFRGQIKVDTLLPYQSCFIYLKDHIDIDEIFRKKGTIRIWLDYEGFFTRIVAGNFKKNKAVSITHSFYDSSSVSDNSAYQDNPDGELHDSYVFIPLYLDKNEYTHLVYYPIYSASSYEMSLTFFDRDGNLIKKLNHWKKFDIQDNKFFTIDIKTIVNAELIDAEREKVKGLMIVNNWNNKGIPTRIKYGLNIGLQGTKYDLPTNICFAPATANPKLLKKPGTFKWAPILNSNESEVVITNCGSQKLYDKPANITIEYYREADDEVFTETFQLLPYAQRVVNIKENTELNQFFGGETGWIAISSDNPFVNAWYFDFNYNSGVVAGDHSF